MATHHGTIVNTVAAVTGLSPSGPATEIVTVRTSVVGARVTGTEIDVPSGAIVNAPSVMPVESLSVMIVTFARFAPASTSVSGVDDEAGS